MNLSKEWLNSPVHQLDVVTEHLAEPVNVGRLNYEVATGTTYFEWSAEAQRIDLDLSPIMMPVWGGVWSSRDDRDLPVEYQGLPGLLNDALPDGWGLYLMDKALARLGIRPELITPATRLAYLGNRAWGSLSFSPVIEDEHGEVMALETLGEQMEATIEGHLEYVSNELLRAGSSPQGARPKVMVDCDAKFQTARVTTGTPAPGQRSWLIKFASRDEPEDAPLMEQVYMDCARSAGLQVMDSRLLDLNGKPAFATERFDRQPDGRVFCHTLGGLLHFSHRAIGLDYINVSEAMDELAVPEPAYRQAYMRAVFNAAMSVRDDHAKNFAFVLGADNEWDISPAYDLTYMTGPGGYHTMTFAEGTGQDPTQEDLLKVAPHYRVEQTEAKQIIEAMVQVARQVGTMARGLGVGRATLAPIEKRLNDISKSIMPARDRGRGR
ncbi:type II toxin-antitoxin system HipA family toxin [Frateuria sp. Soil773]|uniref:type II toxin-antitoxin system HipA family toxin n=1 Tax=Frateuria sp. Soil773 TaxID=1736407 RepID=UPI0009E9452F|nr:type II toxin-antitoxin system HipA family toxin [Frateuria sp. Soil773]